MHVLAALADGPTAVLAVVAILLGLVVVARGRRGERADEEAGPSLLSVPVVVPGAATAAQAGPGTDEGDSGDGLQTMAVGQVGHGAIRLGPIVRPAPEAAAKPELEPEPEPLDPPVSWSALPAPPLPPAEPEPPLDPPTPSSEPSPELAATSEPAAQDPPAADDPPPPAPDAPPVPFRQGTIRLRKPPAE